MSTPLVLTGATGFLGGAVLDVLERAGRLQGTIALTRRPAPALAARGVDVRCGDMRDAAFLAEALPQGCAIVHMAGKVEFTEAGRQAMLDLHVEATRSLGTAALAKGCTRFVLLSSSGTTAVSKHARALDESATYPMAIVARWPYYLSKVLQERLVLDMARLDGLPAVVLNPSLLLGPGDARGGSTQIVQDFLLGKITVAPGGGIGLVDVRDVAEATVAALAGGGVGERYFLGSYNAPFADFFTLLARVADKPAPFLSAPRGVASVGARLLERVGVSSAALSPAKLEMAEHFWYVDWSKATRELGFTPRRPEATLRDTVADLT